MSQDGEPVSKNADEFMKESKKMLEDKKATSEQHKVTLSVGRLLVFVRVIVVVHRK